MSKTALFIVTDGVEELEAVAPLDILRRAGISCTLASQSDSIEILGKNDIKLTADCLLTDVSDNTYDLIVIPGGPGVFTLRKDQNVIELIKAQAEADKWVGAICAAPLLLKDAGLLENKSYTAHFTVADELPNIDEEATVIVDENIITSRGAGTAIDFGLSLVGLLTNDETAEDVCESIHY